MTALRIARAATGRSRVLKFEGCYHGHVDSMLVRAGSGLAGASAASSAGISDGALAETVVVPLDDDEQLDRVFRELGLDAGRRDRRAAAAPITDCCRSAPNGSARSLTRVATPARCSIFDEVISGFRVGLTGMAGALGITPDLTCYGKVIGGGFPVAAYAGRARFMDLVAPLGPVYQAGTLSANPVGMRAGLATLVEDGAPSTGGESSTRAPRDSKPICPRDSSRLSDPPVDRPRGFGPLVPRRARAAAPGGRDRPAAVGAWFARVFHAALARGVYLPPSGFEVLFLSLAHDEAMLARAADALADAMREAAS